MADEVIRITKAMSKEISMHRMLCMTFSRFSIYRMNRYSHVICLRIIGPKCRLLISISRCEVDSHDTADQDSRTDTRWREKAFLRGDRRGCRHQQCLLSLIHTPSIISLRHCTMNLSASPTARERTSLVTTQVDVVDRLVETFGSLFRPEQCLSNVAWHDGWMDGWMDDEQRRHFHLSIGSSIDRRWEEGPQEGRSRTQTHWSAWSGREEEAFRIDAREETKTSCAYWWPVRVFVLTRPFPLLLTASDHENGHRESQRWTATSIGSAKELHWTTAQRTWRSQCNERR